MKPHILRAESIAHSSKKRQTKKGDRGLLHPLGTKDCCCSEKYLFANISCSCITQSSINPYCWYSSHWVAELMVQESESSLCLLGEVSQDHLGNKGSCLAMTAASPNVTEEEGLTTSKLFIPRIPWEGCHVRINLMTH